MSGDLALLTATELAEGVRRRRFSSVEVLRAHQDRIARLNPALNAIVTPNPHAEEDAQVADARVAAGETAGPLNGVPITIKDCFETAGLRTTNAYERTADYVPDRDAPPVAKLRAAGAVILGKTNLPVLAGDGQTDNPIFGRTNNPWNLGCGPGGSSGGDGAAVAARMSALGLGSDIGGSIRLPAHACGVFGVKPTEHRVSTAGYLDGLGWRKTERHMNTVGPLARSVDDLELALRVVAGTDRRFLDIPPVPLGPRTEREVRGLRIAWSASWPGAPTSGVVRRALEHLVRELDAAGAVVEEAISEVPWDEMREAYGALFFAEFGSGMEPDEEQAMVEMFGLDTNSPEPFLRGGAKAVSIGLREYMRLLDVRDQCIRQWETFVGRYDAYLSPVMGVAAFDHMVPGTPIPVDGSPGSYFLTIGGYAEPVNFVGLPAIALPLGMTPDGRPYGYQAIGTRWSDFDLLGVARALEPVSGGVPAVENLGAG